MEEDYSRYKDMNIWDALRNALQPWAYDYNGGESVQVFHRDNVGHVKAVLKAAGYGWIKVHWCQLSTARFFNK